MRTPRVNRTVVIAVTLVVLAALIVLALLTRPRINHVPIRCAARLRTIGDALTLYVLEHHGRYPDQLSELARYRLLPDEFVCPASTDTPAARGATTQQTAQNIDAPGHLSYVYLGASKITRLPASYVLAYERPGNHPNGGNVLFGDGRVIFIELTTFNQMIAQISAGQNPPPATANR